MKNVSVEGRGANKGSNTRSLLNREVRSQPTVMGGSWRIFILRSVEL